MGPELSRYFAQAMLVLLVCAVAAGACGTCVVQKVAATWSFKIERKP